MDQSPGPSKKRRSLPLLEDSVTPAKKVKSGSEDFLRLNKERLRMIATSGSPFVTYKEPMNIYHNVINMTGM